MALGARSKFGTNMFEPEVFRKQIYCIEESTDIVGTFRRPRSHSVPPVEIRRPGNCAPLPTPSRYAPAAMPKVAVVLPAFHNRLQLLFACRKVVGSFRARGQ